MLLSHNYLTKVQNRIRNCFYATHARVQILTNYWDKMENFLKQITIHTNDQIIKKMYNKLKLIPAKIKQKVLWCYVKKTN